MKFIHIDQLELEDLKNRTIPYPTLPSVEPTATNLENEKLLGVICPNCGSELEGRKCKLFCTRRGCGYVVTCSEW